MADVPFVGSFHVSNAGRDVHKVNAADMLGGMRRREIVKSRG